MPPASRVLASILLVLTPLALHAQRAQIDTTFAFSKSGNVNLSLVAGDIRVTAWARNDIRIVATSDVGPIAASFSQNRVRLESRPRRDRSGLVRYEINVPVGVDVHASAVAGSINVSGTRGPLALTTVSGTITASDAKGRSEFETAAGNITLQRLEGITRVSGMSGGINISEVTGDLEIEEVAGPTRIDRADVASLRFESVSGTFDFSGTLAAQGKHSIESMSGTVTLRLATNAGLTIELETFQGDVRGDFPLTLRPASGSDRGRNSDRQEYAVNGGGARVAIETFSGNVILKKIGASERR